MSSNFWTLSPRPRAWWLQSNPPPTSSPCRCPTFSTMLGRLSTSSSTSLSRGRTSDGYVWIHSVPDDDVHFGEPRHSPLPRSPQRFGSQPEASVSNASLLGTQPMLQARPSPLLPRTTDPENQFPINLPRGALCQRCWSCLLVLRLPSPTCRRTSV